MKTFFRLYQEKWETPTPITIDESKVKKESFAVFQNQTKKLESFIYGEWNQPYNGEKKSPGLKIKNRGIFKELSQEWGDGWWISSFNIDHQAEKQTFSFILERGLWGDQEHESVEKTFVIRDEKKSNKYADYLFDLWKQNQLYHAFYNINRKFDIRKDEGNYICIDWEGLYIKLSLPLGIISISEKPNDYRPISKIILDTKKEKFSWTYYKNCPEEEANIQHLLNDCATIKIRKLLKIWLRLRDNNKKGPKIEIK